MKIQIPDLNKAIEHWPLVSAIVQEPKTKKDYERLRKILDALIDNVAKGGNPRLESMLNVIGCLMESYESRNIPRLKADAVGVLKHLMEEHDLCQSDLPEIGSQGVVSEILRGKRKLNVSQIRALSKRFHVSPAVFI